MMNSNYTRTESFQKMRCTMDSSSGVQGQLFYLITINTIISVVAFLGNALILFALRKDCSLHPPSKLLLRCLATTDLLVGLIAEPSNVTYLMSLLQSEWHLCRLSAAISFIVGYLLGTVSLLAISAISVDRLLALYLGLRYRQVVTLKRTHGLILIFWIACSVAAVSYLVTFMITFWYGLIIMSCSLIITVFSYLMLFRTIRRHQFEVQDRLCQRRLRQQIPVDIPRYRNAVSSVLWVQVALIVCYLPFAIVTSLFNNHLSSFNVLIWDLSVILIYLNSALNPFLYCWKISEVKQAVKMTIREALCCLGN